MLRYLLQDHSQQSSKATELIQESGKVVVTVVVLVETLWTLKGKKYNLNKNDLLLVLKELLKEPELVFEDGQTIWRAYNHYLNSVPVKVGTKKKDVDFADALILEKSKYEVSLRGEELEALYTFSSAVTIYKKGGIILNSPPHSKA